MAAVFGNDVFMSGSVGGIYFFADFDRLVPRRLAIVKGIKKGDQVTLGCYFLLGTNLE